VGLTESLAKECAEEGGLVRASVLCPGPVTSNIKDSLRHRPAGETGGLFDVDAAQDGFMASLRWMDPLEVGNLVVDAIDDGRLYVITHPELWPVVDGRFAGIRAAFGR
jgi:NAD(P)-dependent dehydrogenase (short-subunit alcohol dehydrogenase family)